MRASRPPTGIIAGFLFEEHTLPIQRVVVDMALSDLQIYDDDAFYCSCRNKT
jgi:hypothetical protein